MPLPDKDSASGTFGIPFTDAHAVEDPTTDQSADQYNQMGCDVAMMTHTVPRAWVQFVGATISGGPPDAITVVDHDAVWGSGSGVKPTVSHTAASIYIITWATTQVDELGDTHTLNIRKPRAWALIPDRSDARVAAFTANTITVRTFTDSGVANALNGVTIFVEWA
jgi:hypothetical protein